MTTRILVGLVALPFVIVPLYLGGLWSVGLFVLVALLGGWEFFTLAEIGGYRPVRWLGLIWTVALVLDGWQPDYLPLSLLITGGMILTLAHCLYQTDQPLHTWFSTSAGAVYIGVVAGQCLGLRLAPNGLWWVLFGVLITWANDTVAYFTGVTIGRHKLWPRLSPKKTWEGTVGGWIGAAVVGSLFAGLSPLQMGWAIGALLGALGGVFALFGDLSISMLKRQVGVKDSGKLFPGHGGMLDRLDSLLFVLPFIYEVVQLMG